MKCNPVYTKLIHNVCPSRHALGKKLVIFSASRRTYSYLLDRKKITASCIIGLCLHRFDRKEYWSNYHAMQFSIKISMMRYHKIFNSLYVQVFGQLVRLRSHSLLSSNYLYPKLDSIKSFLVLMKHLHQSNNFCNYYWLNVNVYSMRISRKFQSAHGFWKITNFYSECC